MYKRLKRLILLPISASFLFSCTTNAPLGIDDVSWIHFDGDAPLSEDFTYSYHPDVGGFVIEDYKGTSPNILLPESTMQDGISAPIAGIAAYAFYNRKNLQSIALPFSIRYLGDYCFANSGIENLYVTGNLTHVEEHAFDGFSPKVYTKDGIDYLPTRDAKYGFGYQVSGIDKNRKKNGKGRLEVHLPQGCVGFRDHIFDDYEVEVMIPEGCMVLGTLKVTPREEWDNRWETWYGFEEGVTSVKITKFSFEGSPGVYDWEGTFGWYDVQSVDLSSYFGELPVGCFNGFGGSTIQLSDDIFSFGAFCFFKYQGNSFSCPKNLKVIGRRCFEDSSLNNIILDENLEEIGDSAFYNCANLSSLTLPSSLKKIGGDFIALSGIKKIAFPENIEEISAESLHNSKIDLADFSKTKLKDFSFAYYDECPLKDSDVAFVFPSTSTKINLKSTYKLLYKGSADAFANVDVSYGGEPYFYSETAPSEAGNYWHYLDDGEIACW